MIFIVICLSILIVGHSILGERILLQPLFRANWTEPSPRWAMQRILRFAWHITSITWLAMIALALGLSPNLSIALAMLPCACLVFFSLRSHLSWPLFTLAGLAALHTEGWLVPSMLNAGMIVAILSIIPIALLHIYWAFGGRWGSSAAIPSRPDSSPLFSPPPWLTLLVALGLLCLAAGIGAAFTLPNQPSWLRVFLSLAIVVLLLRTVGDGKHIGFSKRNRKTLFAKWDDRLFTPLAVLMAFGAGAALLS